MTITAYRRRRAARGHQRRTRALYYVALVVLAVYSIGPLVIFVFASLKSEATLAADPLSFPTHPLWSNFRQAWDQANLGTGLRNSAIITLGTVAGVCVIAGCAAHAMARLDLPGQIKSLNVSNAAAVALHIATTRIAAER